MTTTFFPTHSDYYAWIVGGGTHMQCMFSTYNNKNSIKWKATTTTKKLLKRTQISVVWTDLKRLNRLPATVIRKLDCQHDQLHGILSFCHLFPYNAVFGAVHCIHFRHSPPSALKSNERQFTVAAFNVSQWMKWYRTMASIDKKAINLNLYAASRWEFSFFVLSFVSSLYCLLDLPWHLQDVCAFS